MNTNTSLSRKRLIFGIFALILMLFSIAIIVFSRNYINDSRSRADLSDDVNALSKELLSDQLNETDKIIASSKRKDKIKDLGRNEPEKFLLIVIPEDIRKTLPLDAQKNIEEKVVLRGIIFENVIEENHGDTKVKKSQLIFQEVDSTGETKSSHDLYLREGLEPDFEGRVQIEGYKIDDVLIPIKIQKENLGAMNINGQSVLGVNTTGVNKLAVIMVNFKNDDSDVANNFTQNDLEGIYFSYPNSVANYIKDTSLGKVTIQGDINDIYGWIDLPEYTRKDVCDIYEQSESSKGFKAAINNLVKPIAASRGKQFDDYNIRAYIFPTISDDGSVGPECTWNAIALGIPGDSTVKPVHFLNGDYDGVNDTNHGALDSDSAIKFYTGILAHETGHNLGFSHAHGIYCGDKQIAAYGSCKIWRYGDRYDLIGGAWDYHSHTNVKNKMLLGWIPSDNKKTITETGTYTIYSGSKNSNQKQLLVIDRPTDGGNYYLDYKSKNNGDGGAPSYIYDGALLRISEVNLPPMGNEVGGTSDEWRTKQTYLIDVDKSDNTYRGGLMNPTFKDGMTFTDSRNDIIIKQLSHDTDSVTLNVTIGIPPCEKVDPSLLIEEPALSGLAGERVRYSLTIKNNNSQSCPETTFDLSSVPPEGWTAAFGRDNVTLASGNTTTVILNISSPTLTTASQNPYLTSITVENSSNATFSKTKQVSYSIETTPKSPTITKAPTNTPTPTKTPTKTPTPTKSPSPTPTKSPTSPPATATPTPVSGTTTLNFPSVKFHGIGLGGDNSNPTSPGNKNPNTKTRVLNIEIFNSSGALVNTSHGDVIYKPDTGDFSGVITLPSSFTSGAYTIKVKSDKYLKKQLTGILTITKDSTNQAPMVDLITGDTNLDNELNVNDFNIIKDCYSDLLEAQNCSDTNKKTRADLSDDGRVNQDDYNLFLRELSIKQGD